VRSRLRRLWTRLVRWWVDPALPPERIGPDADRERIHRPVPIELGFHLHADGKVYHRRRDAAGDRRVDDPAIVGLVHAEYAELVKRARRRLRARAFLGRLARR